MNLTEHFTLEEATFSSTAQRHGIDNTIPEDIMPAIKKSAVGMEKVRAALNNSPIHVDSWYRCLPVNRILGSKDTSQHPKGEAVDFTCPAYGSPVDVCKRLMELREVIRFDQLILEHTWVHISWNSDPGGKQRGEVLSLLLTGKYATGLTDLKGNLL
jgi:zinc D-Ala-D-Ala carboxypeptidase